MSPRLLPVLAGFLLSTGTVFAQGSDSCSGAQAIAGEGIFAFNNAGASTDGSAHALCNAFGQSQIDRDVWFAWTSTFSGTATVSTCGGTGVDTKIAAYAGTSCPTGAPLSCNDDSCGLQSRIDFSATSGSTYLLRIGTFPGASGGSGTFEVSEGSGGGGCANPSSGPDVIVGELTDISDYGSVGGVAAYSLGTTSCNVGDQNLSWIAGNNQHPVIAQNLFRVGDGRIEQIGMSWLKHGFTALQMSACCNCTPSGTGSALGVGCSDPYGSGLNGSQGGLGPRSEVNPFTGAFSYPFGSQGQTGNAVYKRIQVANADLDPAQHPGATYYGEGHYVTPDDAAAGNQMNNASHRRVNVGSFAGGSWNLSFGGSTVREEPAILAWQDIYPAVQLEEVEPLSDGRFIVGSHAFDLGGGQWRYEYAVHNLNSARCAQSFSVPVPAGTSVSNVFFRDVDSHSGEPYSTTDWTSSVAGGAVSWSTEPFATNPNANALRWGTLYSFGFTADADPQTASATLGLFAPGTGNDLLVSVQAPNDAGGCTGNVSNYCISSPNSVGAGAAMGASGSTSVAANAFAVNVSGAVPNQFGIFYYGAGQANAPFGDGVRCVGPGGVGTFRLNPVTTTNALGEMSRPVDFTSPPSAAGTITGGSTWYFQFWYRDPGAGGTGFNLSDGLAAIFCP